MRGFWLKICQQPSFCPFSIRTCISSIWLFNIYKVYNLRTVTLLILFWNSVKLTLISYVKYFWSIKTFNVINKVCKSFWVWRFNNIPKIKILLILVFKNTIFKTNVAKGTCLSSVVFFVHYWISIETGQ